MQFVKNGPDIPARLLQLHEEGKVVFFCGAGISYPSGLPTFSGLVERVYELIGEHPNKAEQEALHKHQYDTTLGLLEQRLLSGRREVRAAIRKALQPDFSMRNATTTHEALLTLSRNQYGSTRLVTTNFDQVFDTAKTNLSTALNEFVAPLLPLPKERWEGVVYLHGKLPDQSDNDAMDNLVVTSGDFGLAYLLERWAARFVSELLRNFTVCFVGYGINDPVLRYMVDALAADKQRGENTKEMFAFAPKGRGKQREEKSLADWQAKNVTPILYTETKTHLYLHSTLKKWAEVYKDGALGKNSIVVQTAQLGPARSTEQEDLTGRLIWALSDLSGIPAKKFAELDPPPSIDWLEEFEANRFEFDDLVRFGVQPNSEHDPKLSFSLLFRPAPYNLAAPMTLAFSPFHSVTQWDPPMRWLAVWLAKLVREPQLLFWIAKQGGRLHPHFASMIAKEIETLPPNSIGRRVWSIALLDRLGAQSAALTHWELKTLTRKDLPAEWFALAVSKMLQPRLVLQRPYPRGLSGEGPVETTLEDDISKVRNLFSFKIDIPLDDSASIAELSKAITSSDDISVAALPKIAAALLEVMQTLEQVGQISKNSDFSYIHRPSVMEHDQNQGFESWAALVGLAIEILLKVEKANREVALLEVRRWFSTEYPIFKRLAFAAAANTNLVAPSEAIRWLRVNDAKWLWNVECRREVIRLLVSLAERATKRQASGLLKTILAGPPEDYFKDGLSAEEVTYHSDRMVWLYLAKLDAAGLELSGNAKSLFSEIGNEHPEWELADDESDEFPFYSGVDIPRTQTFAPTSAKALVEWLRESPKADVWTSDNWAELCNSDYETAVNALKALSGEGIFPEERWAVALSQWIDGEPLDKSWHDVGPILLEASEDKVQPFAHTIGIWLKSVADKDDSQDEAILDMAEKLIRMNWSSDEVQDDIAFYSINHPIGFAAQAVINWWYRTKPQDGQRLNDQVREILELIVTNNDPIFIYARAILASQLISIYRVDRAWAKEFLLPLFRWSHDSEIAAAMWTSFLLAPRLHWPLIHEMRTDVLEAANRLEELKSDYRRQYTNFLTYIALFNEGEFKRDELRTAFNAFPIEELPNILRVLTNALEAAGDKSDEYWEHRVKPFVEWYWPKDASKQNDKIANGFARLALVSRGKFPEALALFCAWISHVNEPDFLVRRIKEVGVCRQFPVDALTLLSKVISSEGLWHNQDDLKECLKAIAKSNRTLVDNPRYKQLNELAHRR